MSLRQAELAFVLESITNEDMIVMSTFSHLPDVGCLVAQILHAEVFALLGPENFLNVC